MICAFYLFMNRTREHFERNVLKCFLITEPMYSQEHTFLEDPLRTKTQRRPNRSNTMEQTVLFTPLAASSTSTTPNRVKRSSDCQFSNRSPNFPAKRTVVHGSGDGAYQRPSKKVERPMGNSPPDFEYNRHFNNEAVDNEMNSYYQSPKHNMHQLPPPCRQMSYGGQMRPSNFTGTTRDSEPSFSSQSITIRTPDPKMNQRASNNAQAAKITRTARKRLEKAICDLDNASHLRYEAFSCELCRFIFPDADSLRRHSQDDIHLTRLLEICMGSGEKAKVIKTEVVFDENYGSSSDSERSDETSPKQRVRWNLQDNVATI